MELKIWDNHNKQWLEPMAIYFDKNNQICKVTACKNNTDILKNGWYDITGKDLKKIAIQGSINLNTHLIPNDGNNISS